MYSLDVNFLNDRTERPSEAGLGGVQGRPESNRPLYLGVGVGVFLPVLMGALWFLFQQNNTRLEERQAELDSQLTALQAQLNEVNTINTQIQQLDTDNRALATVFNYIKPWSAILQDVRDRVPAGVQIASIVQAAPETPPAAAPAPPPPPSPGAPPAAAPAPPPAPPSVITISGQAQNFNDVNDFFLTLQRSPFLDTESLRLQQAELVDNPITVETQEGAPGGGQVEVQLPRVVNYTISANLTNLPTSDLMEELERTLAVGLVSRIQTLRDKGVIQP